MFLLLQLNLLLDHTKSWFTELRDVVMETRQLELE
jgi:hypothetical protein